MHRSGGDGCAIVRLCGELDVAGAPAVRAFLLDELQQGHIRLVLDATDLTFIDASGINALLFVAKRAVQAGGWVHLTGASALLRRCLCILHLTTLLPTDDRLDAALRDTLPPARSRTRSPA